MPRKPRKTEQGPAKPDSMVDDAAGKLSNETIARLFEEHNQNLLRFVMARLRSPQEAREIAQEAYVRLLNLEDDNTVSYLRSYLYRIAANLVNDRIKQRETRARLRNLAFFEDDKFSPGPESVLKARQGLDLVNRAISSLPSKCRQAFLLNKVHDLTIQDTAERMGISKRMVCLYVARALARCREYIEMAEQDR